MEFRLLRADEIDARVNMVRQDGLTILLYKDARCDMNILDETVGALNWQRHHSRENANCTVAIWDDKKVQWIEKEDTGTESNTEKEKGLASDSFKRACFNWGIGRELYTAPTMWVTAKDCKIEPKGQGYVCRDRFVVDEIRYTGRAIEYVRLRNVTQKTVIDYGNRADPKVAVQRINRTKAAVLMKALADKNKPIQVIFDEFKITKLEELNEAQFASIIRRIEKSSGGENRKG